MGFPEIPGYELQEVIGKGGMGVVYKARHLALDRIVALKVLHEAFAGDEGFLKSFSQEAKTIAKLLHPNIVSVYDFGNYEGTYYLSMQYVQGRPVMDVMASRKLSMQECASIMLQMGEALDFAHRHGIIHRDIKPGNILLCPDGKAMVMDFGVAYGTYDSGATTMWIAAGSPAYMSPEQCKGRNASPRSDQYSLGVTVYEMLTGRLPFGESDPVTVMRQHISETPAPLRMGRTDIGPRLEAAVNRALSKMPEMRFQSVGEFAREFDEAWRDTKPPETLVGAAPAAFPVGNIAGIGRAPVSLVDGQNPNAARHNPMAGYVYATAAGDRRGSSVWKWAIALVLAGGLGGAGYIAYQHMSAPSGPSNPSGAPPKSKTAPSTPPAAGSRDRTRRADRRGAGGGVPPEARRTVESMVNAAKETMSDDSQNTASPPVDENKDRAKDDGGTSK